MFIPSGLLVMFMLLGCLAMKAGGRYRLSHSIPRIESGDKYTMNKSNYTVGMPAHTLREDVTHYRFFMEG